MYHAVVAQPLEVFDWCFVDAGAFEAQMTALRERFDVVPLAGAVARLAGGLTRPTAVLTFDDGFMNNHDVAFPILRRLGLPATIFVCTDLVDTQETLWFCRLNRALAGSAREWLDWDGRRFDLRGAQARAATSATLQASLKRWAPDGLLRELRTIIVSLDEDPDRPVEPASPYRILSRSALRAMQASGLVEIGGHSRAHTILSQLAPHDRRDQIAGSVAAVATLTGRPCRLFAYPNGRAVDYTPDCLDILADCGVETAVTAIDGTNDASTPPLELLRRGVGGDMTLDQFAALVDPREGRVD
jgi:peptidoglycan/xylan/chitin deacetylase (PgdA/CDA1 family)